MADVIAIYVVVDVKTTEADVIASILSKWQMVLPFFYVAGGRPLDCMLQHFEGDRCYCQAADGITTFYTLFEDGRCYC